MRVTLAANSIPSKYLKITSRGLESSSPHWVKCTFTELRSVFGLLQKNLGTLKVVTHNIYFSNMIFHLTFMKLWLILITKKALLMDQDKGKP